MSRGGGVYDEHGRGRESGKDAAAHLELTMLRDDCGPSISSIMTSDSSASDWVLDME